MYFSVHCAFCELAMALHGTHFWCVFSCMLYTLCTEIYVGKEVRPEQSFYVFYSKKSFYLFLFCFSFIYFAYLFYYVYTQISNQHEGLELLCSSKQGGSELLFSCVASPKARPLTTYVLPYYLKTKSI